MQSKNDLRKLSPTDTDLSINYSVIPGLRHQTLGQLNVILFYWEQDEGTCFPSELQTLCFQINFSFMFSVLRNIVLL